MTNRPTENLNNLSTAGGNWSSPITAELIIKDSISLFEPNLTSNSLYYIECRPQQGGRCVIVKVNNNKMSDVLPAPYSARSRVHEYGGGCFCVDDGHVNKDTIFFINDSDQNIYSIKNEQITRVTTSNNQRFADFSFDQKFNRLIAICETHSNNQVNNSIVSIDIDSGEISTIEEGSDFYASPRLNPSLTQLCWQSWNHPNMPWDGNQLWLADLSHDGQLTNKKQIAGSEDISIFQPQWSPDGVLYFISDDTGWWHLYRYQDTKHSTKIKQLTEGEKEFGLPQWAFAQSTYAFINSTQIICSYQSQGKTNLVALTLNKNSHSTILKTPWQEFSTITACNNRICFIAASSLCFPQLVLASLKKDALITDVIKSSSQLSISSNYYSNAQTITFTNRHKQTVYANYYPPTNPDYLPIKGEPPPLIVICHGGPTGQSSAALDPKKQFWTSRGFALLDVNYSGSTGYGRDYRLRLINNWGKLDVTDCCDAALYAVSRGLANKNQLIIRGSSAGGYTVLSALTFENVFSAGASYYGISELTSLARDTHKFESHYLDRLIGPYPESSALYQQRSPINSTERLNCPVIFFQGSEDKVVPMEQAEKMFDALNKKGLPVAAQYFKGEQHGFRKAETIKQSLENELSFYQLIFNLRPKDEISFEGDIQIRNI
jgi:dipeptidyl aminopeptidase/acylaminoacyl peptidase